MLNESVAKRQFYGSAQTQKSKSQENRVDFSLPVRGVGMCVLSRA